MARWRRICGGLGAALGIAGTACDGSGGGHHSGGGFVSTPGVDLAPAFGGASFNSPVKLVQHPTNDDRWYVVEQGGRVQTFLASNPSNITTAANVVTQAGVNFGSGDEQGLLGMAFDPNFATSGEIYLTYTDENRRRLGARALGEQRRRAHLRAGHAGPSCSRFPHPLANHNGGDIVFGPDGFLYYSMGDGGGADDPDDNGQDRNVLLGKILRIDVNASQGSAIRTRSRRTIRSPGIRTATTSSAPAAQPCPEICAFGFRNPWRMNFDPDDREALRRRRRAESAGRDRHRRERRQLRLGLHGGRAGAHDAPPRCNFASFTAPEVVHGRTEARAITGGAVYRGSAVPALQHFYVYGDFETGLFFAFDVQVADAPAQRLAVPVTNVSAFGQGRDGEVYVVSFGSPSIQRFVPQSG